MFDVKQYWCKKTKFLVYKKIYVKKCKTFGVKQIGVKISPLVMPIKQLRFLNISNRNFQSHLQIFFV